MPGISCHTSLDYCRPLAPGSAGGFGEDLAAAGLRQGIQLQVEGLFAGRDPGVANLHRIIVSKPALTCKNQNTDSETTFATGASAWDGDDAQGSGRVSITVVSETNAVVFSCGSSFACAECALLVRGRLTPASSLDIRICVEETNNVRSNV